MPICPFCDKEISTDATECIYCSEDFKEYIIHTAQSLVLKWRAVQQKEILVWLEQIAPIFVFWILVATFPVIAFYYLRTFITNYSSFLGIFILLIWIWVFFYAVYHIIPRMFTLIVMLINNNTSYFYIKNGRKINMARIIVRLMKFEKLREWAKQLLPTSL